MNLVSSKTVLLLVMLFTNPHIFQRKDGKQKGDGRERKGRDTEEKKRKISIYSPQNKISKPSFVLMKLEA